MADNRVKVGVRVRPLLDIELEAGADSVIKSSSKRVVMNVPSKKNTFDFDWSFGPKASHREVYEEVCKPLVKNIFEGFNATVFAYGQTGSGKTFTMGNGVEATEGVIPFAINDIFAEKALCEAQNMSVSLEMSFMEVYMEDCFDLLSRDRRKIDLRETSKGETYPESLTMRPITSANKVRNLLAEAAQVRSTGRTAMNTHSSRSHAICTFYLRIIESRPESEGGDEFSRAIVSKLHLVDLAGSERAKKTQATGDVFAEGVSINKGLLALGNVIVALSSQGKDSSHIPYRDSKITRLLKDSLGGNGKTVMLACASPADVNFEETLNTLRFASRASTIVNNAQVNIDESDLVMDDGRALPPSVAKELVFLRTQNSTLQQQVDAMSAIMGAQRPSEDQMSAIDKNHLYGSAKLLLSSVTEMVGAQKSILIKCLEEDFTLEEPEVEGMTATISSAKELIGSYMAIIRESSTKSFAIMPAPIPDTDMSFNMSFLPPIMKLIEDLDTLQEVVCAAMESITQTIGDGTGSASVLKSRKKKRCHGDKGESSVVKTEKGPSEFNENGSAVDKILAACSEESSVNNEDMDNGRDEQSDSDDDESLDEEFGSEEAAAMEEKDTNVLNMVKVAEQYKATIISLRSEISNLENEKTQLALNEAREKKANTPASAVVGKVQKELLEKTRTLEAKLKQLRQKEVEYARIYQEKERARREAEQLRKELTDALKKRVATAKKLKEESDHHLAEKKKLQQAEMQSRRRELQAQNTVQKLNKEFSNRERVLKGQLQEKEREVKRQKELILKQQKVKAAREAVPAKRFSGMGPNSLGVRTEGVSGVSGCSGSSDYALSTQREAALDMWLSQEVASQTKRNFLNEDIEGMMENRAKVSRKLHSLKAQRGATETTSSVCFPRESEVKHLEDEVRGKSIILAKHQGMLADLGTVVEKRRFVGITDARETKYIMNWMFQKLSKDLPLSQRASDAKLSAQEEQIEVLKRQLSVAESHLQQLEEQASPDHALNISSGSVSTAAEVSNSAFRKRSGSSMSSVGTVEYCEEKSNDASDRRSGASRTSNCSKNSSTGTALRAAGKRSSTSAGMRSKVLKTAQSVNAAIKGAKGVLKGCTGNVRPVSAPVECTGQSASQLSDEDDNNASFDDISSVDDPMDESFRPPSDDDSDYDDDVEFSDKQCRRKNGDKKSKTSESSSSSSMSGKKRSIESITHDVRDVVCRTSEAPVEPAAKRSSPFPRDSPHGDSNIHANRRRSISGTPSEGMNTSSVGRKSLAGGFVDENKASKTRKLRRASIAGAADLEFVHTDLCNESVDKENKNNRREKILPPNLETYCVRDLKELLSSRGLSQSGKKADLISRLRIHDGYHFS